MTIALIIPDVERSQGSQRRETNGKTDMIFTFSLFEASAQLGSGIQAFLVSLSLKRGFSEMEIFAPQALLALFTALFYP
jgi:hypothetical protein